jgi:hypothetical protein
MLRNELAAGMISGAPFGDSAVCLLLALRTHNLLMGLKRVAVKPEYLRLRVQIFCSPGRLIHHAGRLLARMEHQFAELQEWA